MDLASVAASVVLGIVGIAVPYGLVLGQQAVNAHVHDARLRQWATGALSAAGKAYVTVLAMRQADPTAPIGDLVQKAVHQEAEMFMINHAENAKAIDATPVDGHSAVKGQLGVLLAADPTVSVAAAPVVMVEVSPPPVKA